MKSIGHRLRELAAEHGSRPALIFRETVVSYASLAEDARHIAAALARIGVSKGTRVGLLMPNRPNWLRCAFGAWRLGAIVVPLNTLHRGPEMAYALRHADVTILLMVSRFLNHDYTGLVTEIAPEVGNRELPLRSATLPCLRHIVCRGERLPRAATAWEDFLAAGSAVSDRWIRAALDAVEPADDAAIFFTSGSTSAPKGVVHTHASMLQAADNIGERLGLTADDRTYGYLPLFFNGGLVGVALATLSRGGAVLLQDVFDPGEALALMERHGCTTFFGWPHQAEALARHPSFDRRRLSIRKGPGANAKWAPFLLPPDHQAVSTWGMTETGPMASCSRWDDPIERREGAHGHAMPGLELRIADPETNRPLPRDSEGELLVRGSSLMRTYYKRSAAECFDAEGFFHTGDLARIDERGDLHFLGRLNDVIKTAGVSVAAAEVEAALAEHEGVKVALVVPVPDPSRGENVAAFVVRADAACDTAQLIEHCRRRLAAYKVPRHVFFVDEKDLPTLGSGKIDRRLLGARAAELAALRSEKPA